MEKEKIKILKAMNGNLFGIAVILLIIAITLFFK